MDIRTIHKDELEGLLKLYEQLHENPFPEIGEDLLKLWDGITSDNNHYIIVAVDGGRIVSSCVMILVPNLTHGQRPYAFVENVITDEEYRNRGLASACLNYAKEIAVQNNCYKMMLMTGSKEEHTLNFYRKAGYNSEDKAAFIQWL